MGGWNCPVVIAPMVLVAPVLNILNAELPFEVSIHTGEANLQKNLRRRWWDIHIHEIDDLAGGVGYLNGAVRIGEVFYCSAEDNEIIFGSDVDIFCGQGQLEFTTNRRDVVLGCGAAGMNGNVEKLTLAALLPHDETACCPGLCH